MAQTPGSEPPEEGEAAVTPRAWWYLPGVIVGAVIAAGGALTHLWWLTPIGLVVMVAVNLAESFRRNRKTLVYKVMKDYEKVMQRRKRR